MVQQSESEKFKSKYQVLHERGVVLPDEGIDFVFGEMTRGIVDVYDYLGITGQDRNLGLMVSGDGSGITYSRERQLVDVPVSYLNSVETTRKGDSVHTLRLDLRVIGVVNFPRYLINAAREEAVHHFQFVGHPRLSAQLENPELYEAATEEERLLSASEVEARGIVDEIAKQCGEIPLWESLEEYLKKEYHDKYGKPLGKRALTH